MWARNDGQFRTIAASCMFLVTKWEKNAFLSFITTFQTDFRVINKTTHKGDKNRLRFYVEYHTYTL